MKMKDQSNILSTKAAIVLALCLLGTGAWASVSYEMWGTSLSTLPPLGNMDTSLGPPAEKGIVGNFDISKMAGKDAFVFRFKTYIKIETTGTYTFYTSSDDGSMVYVGDWYFGKPMTTIVDNNGLHGADTEKSGTIDLAVGYHGVIVTMFEKDGGDALTVRYSGPGVDKQTIPASVLFSNPLVAQVVFPTDGAINVPITAQIEWSAPLDIVPSGYDVYFGTDPVLPAGSKVLSGQNVTAYDPPGNLAFNTIYYWRVDPIDPNNGGTPKARTGPIWSFTTQPEKPVFTTQPKGLLIDSGQTGTFTVVVLSPYAFSYQWYKVGTPDITVGTNSPSLDVTEEGTYYCKATNTAGSTDSNRVTLTFKKMIGYWKFDGNTDDATAFGNNGTLFNGASFQPGIDGQAVSFDGMDDYVEIPAAAFTQMTDQAVTVSMWINGGVPIPVVNSVLYAQDEARARVLNISMPYKETDGIIPIFWDAGGSAGYDRIVQGVVPTEHKGRWNHYLFTKDVAAGTMNITINGEPWLRGTGLSKTLGIPYKCVIGAALTSTGTITEPFPGLVDDVRIYNYVLSAEESATLYYAMTGKTACMVPVANDLSGDCKMNLEDFAMIAQQWLVCNMIPQTACP